MHWRDKERAHAAFVCLWGTQSRPGRPTGPPLWVSGNQLPETPHCHPYKATVMPANLPGSSSPSWCFYYQLLCDFPGFNSPYRSRLSDSALTVFFFSPWDSQFYRNNEWNTIREMSNAWNVLRAMWLSWLSFWNWCLWWKFCWRALLQSTQRPGVTKAQTSMLRALMVAMHVGNSFCLFFHLYDV